MSKNNNKGKPKKEEPYDYITEIKNLNYTIYLKENEIDELKRITYELKDRTLNLMKDNNDLKASCVMAFKNENEVKHAKESLELSEKENLKLKDEIKSKLKEFEESKDEMKKKYEHEISKLKNILDSYHQKIETANNIQALSAKQEETIKILELENDKIRIEADEKIKNKEIKNQIKFSDLKKKMMENIQETQKNVTQLNIEYMDVSTKLTLLQNHQLLMELEYQSQQIEELLKKKEVLEKKVFELNRDIEIHKEVEISLAEKNKKYSDMVRLLEKNQSEALYNQNAPLNNGTDGNESARSIYVNNSIKEFSTASNLEKKIIKLEKNLKKKSEDYMKMKDNFDNIEEKLKIFTAKYINLYKFFEDQLDLFYEDEELKNNKEIFINLENLKQGDFSAFSNQEKYSILVILMKYLLPLLNASDLKVLSNSPSGINNVNNVNLKYHFSQKYLEDPLLKKVFQSKKGTMVQSIRRSIESLPTINNSQNKGKHGSLDSRIANSKYQAVF
jgi:hypothetical protein